MKLYDLLTPELHVFLDKHSINPGEAWREVLDTALRGAYITVVLVSPRISNAHYAQEEITIIIDLMRRFPERHLVVPVFIEDLEEKSASALYGLRSRQGLFARTDEEREQTAARLVTLVRSRGKTARISWDDVWSSRTEPSNGREGGTEARILYPTLRFVADFGEEVQVRSPTELAEQLDRNPVNGRVFLYGRYYESSGWDSANPGLCAALRALTEQRYPNDKTAGLTAALYLLDPQRPYRSGTEVMDNLVSLATHLSLHSDLYQVALREPRHPLWLYLAARTESAVREGMHAFSAAFTSPHDESVTDDAVTTALSRLILWLRQMGGDVGLTFEGTYLSAPAEIAGLPYVKSVAIAAALTNPASILSVWVQERAPELSGLVGAWRRVHPRDPLTLAYAVGLGVRVGRFQIRTPADVVNPPAGLASALWGDDEGVRECVDSYLTTFHSVPLVIPTLDRLRAVPDDPYALRMATYVAGHAASFPDPADIVLYSLPGMLFDALHAAHPTDSIVLSAAEERVVDLLVVESMRALAAPKQRLERLSSFLRTVIPPGASQGVEAQLWSRFLLSLDDALVRAYCEGIADPRMALEVLRTADAHISAALAKTSFMNIPLRFAQRYSREEARARQLAATIDTRMAEELSHVNRTLAASEARARVYLKARARKVGYLSPVFRFVDRARLSTLVLLFGLIVFAVTAIILVAHFRRFAYEYGVIYPDEPRGAVDLYSAMLLGVNSVGLSDSPFMAVGLAMVSCFVVGVCLVSIPNRPLAAAGAMGGGLIATILIAFLRDSDDAIAISTTIIALVLAVFAMVVYSTRLWCTYQAETRREIERLGWPRHLADAFQQLQSTEHVALDRMEKTWRVSMRRAIALADTPELAVLPDAPEIKDRSAANWTVIENAVDATLKVGRV